MQLQVHVRDFIINVLTASKLGTSLLCFYFYPLCYAAVLVKFTYYTQEQEFLSDYYAFINGNSLHVADNFIHNVLLECMNGSTSMLYHTMTVLLEYIDHSLQFSINA